MIIYNTKWFETIHVFFLSNFRKYKSLIPGAKRKMGSSIAAFVFFTILIEQQLLDTHIF
jgi:hypothetical protein